MENLKFFFKEIDNGRDGKYEKSLYAAKEIFMPKKQKVEIITIHAGF
jgi:hypothetical protein